jgi:hypothetical protein
MKEDQGDRFVFLLFFLLPSSPSVPTTSSYLCVVSLVSLCFSLLLVWWIGFFRISGLAMMTCVFPLFVCSSFSSVPPLRFSLPSLPLSLSSVFSARRNGRENHSHAKVGRAQYGCRLGLVFGTPTQQRC